MKNKKDCFASTLHFLMTKIFSNPSINIYILVFKNLLVLVFSINSNTNLIVLLLVFNNLYI